MAAPEVHALASQVGGHAGVMTTEDGSLLIKPASKRELEFYQRLQSDPSEALANLRRFTPKFLGTLTLEGKTTGTSGEGEIQIQPVADRKDEHSGYLSPHFGIYGGFESLVLQNLSFGYLHPNILDIKLGQVLYDETASEEKVARMIKTARDTTSLETGVRLTGFQVYDNATGLPVNTPKSYGKSIKAAQLIEGITRFFPAHGDESAQGTFGLPQSSLLSILDAIRDEISELRAALADLEFRMVGASILIIYEADWERAEAVIKRLSEDAPQTGSAEENMDEDEAGEESDEEDEEEKYPPLFTVKLIDFAHTRVEAGIGADEGVLLGIDTALSLLDQRIQHLEEKQ